MKKPLKENTEEAPMVIDLGAARNGALEESFLTAFGTATKMLLSRMFGVGDNASVKIRGTRSEVDAFAKTISNEKRYMDAYTQYGLSDPRTYKSKFELENAIKKFTQKTSLPWPLK